MASGQGHGSMSMSMKLIRLLIVLFNFTFIIVGITLLAIGTYVVKDPKMHQLRLLLNPELSTAYSGSFSNIEIFAIAIIAIGGALLFLGFLGCCGAVKGFRFLHLVYALILGVILIAEIAIVAVFFAYQNRFRTELVTKLQDSIATYYVGVPTSNTTSANPVSLSWDFAQFNLQCCGAVGKNDYTRAVHWDRKNPYEANTNLTVPFTCCPLGAAKSWTELPSDLSPANACAQTSTNAYSQGCYDRLVGILATYKNNIIIGGAIIGGIELFAMIFAILLWRRKEDYRPM